MPTCFLPGDIEQALSSLLKLNLDGLDVSPIGDAEIDDDDQLVLEPPLARPRYLETSYGQGSDLTQTTYDDVNHVYEIWCAAENLVSKEAQRSDSKVIAGRVATLLAGAILQLTDGGKSCPVRLLGISSVPGDVIGMVYLVRVAVPGIAQFPGGATNAS
jgi:hypothetical protein